jgi:hypothetical protein
MDEQLELLIGKIMKEVCPCDTCPEEVRKDCEDTGYECIAFESYVNQGFTKRKPKPRVLK